MATRPETMTPAQYLAQCSTSELFELLSEIVEPAHFGPLGHAYNADEDYEHFADAIEPVSRAYRDHYQRIAASVEQGRRAA